MLCCGTFKIYQLCQYYAQEQELGWEYYAIYIQVYMKNSIHVTYYLKKDCFVKVYLWMVSPIMFYHTMTVLLEHIDHLLLSYINA